ncbi:MAG: class II aldolase/adducin family protein [Hyphomicrobiaceae bacterium]
MTKPEQALRQAIVEACRWMNASGLNQGTSGNISVRWHDVMLITPSSTPYDTMTPEMIATMPLARGEDTWHGPLKPSSEWRFHQAILVVRPEVGAIVHTHSVHATALSMTRKSIPPCHYMIAAFGGADVRVADYATFGTAELSENALIALEHRTACLLANHGMIALGRDLEQAMWRAVELETLARQYILALQAGGPVLLTEAEIAAARAKFGGYGR